MAATIETTEKQNYFPPRINLITLDSEISLVLESTPPEGPGEGGTGYLNAPQYFNNDPYKIS